MADRGRDDPEVVKLWIGEGDLPTPDFVTEAVVQALREGHTRYTYSLGLPRLRQALSDYHRRHWGVEVAPSRFSVTSGGMNAVSEPAVTEAGAAGFLHRFEGLRARLAVVLGMPTAELAVAGGVPDIVRDGSTGLLTPVGDEAAFADAVAALLPDPARRSAFGLEAARVASAEHGFDGASRTLDTLLRSLARSR